MSVPQKPIPAPRSSRPKTPPDNLDNTPDPDISVGDDSLRDQICTTALETQREKLLRCLCSTQRENASPNLVRVIMFQ